MSQNNPQSSSALRLLGSRANETELARVNTSKLPDAALAMVVSSGDLYRLDRAADPATATGPDVIVPSSGGPGVWQKLVAAGAASSIFALYLIEAAEIASGVSATPTLDVGGNGFSIVSDQIQVPMAGVYEATMNLAAYNNSGIADQVLGASLLDGVDSYLCPGTRVGTAQSTIVNMSKTALFVITTPATQRIRISNPSIVPVSYNNPGSTLVIKKVG